MDFLIDWLVIISLVVAFVGIWLVVWRFIHVASCDSVPTPMETVNDELARTFGTSESRECNFDDWEEETPTLVRQRPETAGQLPE